MLQRLTALRRLRFPSTRPTKRGPATQFEVCGLQSPSTSSTLRESAPRAGEVEHGRGDVLGLAHPAQRGRRGRLVHGRSSLEHEVHRLVMTLANRYGVDADSGRRSSGEVGVVGERRLRSAVGEKAATGDPLQTHEMLTIETAPRRPPASTEPRTREGVGGQDVEVERLLEKARIGVEQGLGSCRRRC